MPIPTKIVVDSFVLINLLCLNCMDLIGLHRSKFIVTDHVTREITAKPEKYQEEIDIYRSACRAGQLTEIRVNSLIELGMFGQFSVIRDLDAGESSAFAVALNRSCPVATEDKKAIERMRRVFNIQVRILTTLDIIRELIECGEPPNNEANTILENEGIGAFLYPVIQSC